MIRYSLPHRPSVGWWRCKWHVIDFGAASVGRVHLTPEINLGSRRVVAGERMIPRWTGACGRCEQREGEDAAW